jgi:serine/threonine protein kinase
MSHESIPAPTLATLPVPPAHSQTWTRERWQLVSPYLDHALDLNDDEREAFLNQLTAKNARLADDLRSLLLKHVSANNTDFLQRLTAPASLASNEDASLSGVAVGAYRLLQPIGAGGMGTVWLAERADGRFQGKAAVKLLNLSLVGNASAERFRREGSILAKLSHPNIAHLIDAGLSPTHQPYLILEYVEGLAIDEHCRVKSLSARKRIELFLSVLAGVSHAHSQLIVHRDIKPHNVLVDQNGDVKLLDFGIAKILHDDIESLSAEALAEANDLTRVAGNAFTPHYASPEQIRRETVGTASDIYSLGALLYVLLTERLPYNVSRQTAAAFEEAILANNIGPLNRSDNKTQFTIDRDLEAIVLKAMQLKAADRYESVVSLRDDLQRYLEGKPVRARGRARGYIALRFARRHWLPIAATVGAFTALSIAAITIYHESEGLRITKSYLLETLTPTSYYNDGGGLLSQREMLLRAANGIEQRFADRPKIAAELYESIGESLFNMGEHEDSFQVRSKAQPLIDRTFGATSRPAIRNAARATYMHLTQRRFAEFEKAFAELRARCPLAANGAPRDPCYSLEWMQSMYRDHIGESRLAVAHWKEMDALVSPTVDRDNRWHVLAGYWGAVAAIDSGDVEQSKRFWQRLLAAKDVQANAKGNHMYALAASRLLNDSGFHEEAATLSRRVYDQGNAYMGGAFDPRLFYIASVAHPQSAVGKTFDTEQSLRDSIYKPDPRRTPQDTVAPRAALGLMLIAKNQFDEARIELNETLTLYQARPARHNEHAVRVQLQLATLDAIEGKLAPALETIRNLRDACMREGDQGGTLRANALLAAISTDQNEANIAWQSAVQQAEQTSARPPDLRVLLRALKSPRELPPPKDDATLNSVRAFAQKVLDDTDLAMKQSVKTTQH